LSSSESFYWHDYETSGAEVSVDRPVQFAGVRTDLDFNPIGEPLVVFSRPTPDYLPHPTAVRITAISPLVARAQGLPECEFIHRIHDELAQPGTCGVGYNSIRFDDEITRYTLYRNFFEPYAREFGAGRSRWDLMDPARAIYALRPAGIEWPQREDGYTSFRLEELSAANGIEHSAAHDALSDVYATIGLASVLKRAQPALFDAMFSMRSKQAVAMLLNPQGMKPVIHVSGMFGASRSNLAMIVPLAEHPTNRNEVICADLSLAPDFLLEPAADVRARLFASQADLSPGQVRPPLKTIKINRAPVVLPAEWVAGEPAERLGLDGAQHRASLAALRGARNADPAGFTQFIQSLYSERQFPKREDPDSQLYDGFFDRSDTALFQKIRTADPESLRDQGWVFKDPRLPELLFRYRARNYPDTLTEDETLRWVEHCQSKLSDPNGFGFAQFQAELSSEMALPNLTEKQRSALTDLTRYVQELAAALNSAGAVPQ